MTNKNIRDTKGIARNTIALYLRSIITLTLGVYTSRVVLEALGVDDYGIYNVIGGFVAMFSILSASLVNASQRFISYEMGKDEPKMERLFSGTVSIHLLLALGVFIVFETFGIWFLNTQLNINNERITAANWVFQCSVLAFCINLINVPYIACIVAHEKMSAFAYFSIFDSLARLGIVFLLYIIGFDRLVVYAILMLFVAILLRLLYKYYCIHHFSECSYHFILDKPLLKEMLGFTGWNFIGSTAGILSTQGINILINIFFGVALNAARGVAEQVNQAINTFVTNFTTAVNPQITKSFAAGDYEYMNMLMARGAKYAAILFWLMALTVFIETDTILDIWLVETPPYASVFLRWAIICSIFQALSQTLYVGMLATGNIKKYQIVMGVLYVGSFLLCLLFFKIGYGPEYGYISTFITFFIALFVRLRLISQIVPGFSARVFFVYAVVRSFLAIILSTLFVYSFKYWVHFNNRWVELLLVLLLSVMTVGVFSLLVAFSRKERTAILQQLNGWIRRNA